MSSQRNSIGRAGGAGVMVPGGAQRCGVNVGSTERVLSVAGGSFLAWLGLKEGGPPGIGLALLGGGLIYRGLSGHCPAYASMHRTTAAAHSPQASVAAGRGIKVTHAIAINSSAEDLYNIWRDFENLPRFMSHLVRVTSRGRRSHWVAHGPAGTEVAWDAEVYTEDPGRMLSWRSLAGSQVDTAGSVHFTPLSGGRGTEVVVTLKYDPPGGALGAGLAWLFGQDPASQIRADLERFKEQVEAGAISASESRSSRF